MRKLILIVLVFFCFSSLLSAADSFEVQVVTAKTKSPLVSLILQYTPHTHTLVAVYTIKHLPFDEGDALMAIRDSIVRFAGENNYRTYKPCAKDVVKYRQGETQLTRIVVLSE